MMKLFARIFQGIMWLACHLINWRQPKCFKGENCREEFVKSMVEKNHKNMLLVTDKGISNLGLYVPLKELMEKNGINVFVYDEVAPNPTVKMIEAGLEIYKNNNCDGLVAFGGGSAMDCAKGIGARAVKPHKSVNKMAGLFKILKRIPDLYAVPTTAGTGSETTVAAVITDDETHHKYAINDISLIPRYALLDPTITIGLPPIITATTGMDALVHAVEAYIGKANVRYTRESARKAVKLIFENLEKVYAKPDDLEGRANMLEASYEAGVAFTRAYVGCIHSVSHSISGKYGVAHGYGNAVIMPHVLKYYGHKAWKPLAELADLVGIGNENDGIATKANKFIKEIENMNERMGIPKTIQTAKIKEEDIDEMANNAYKEGFFLYPTPRILNKNELKQIYYTVM